MRLKRLRFEIGADPSYKYLRLGDHFRLMCLGNAPHGNTGSSQVMRSSNPTNEVPGTYLNASLIPVLSRDGYVFLATS